VAAGAVLAPVCYLKERMHGLAEPHVLRLFPFQVLKLPAFRGQKQKNARLDGHNTSVSSHTVSASTSSLAAHCGIIMIRSRSRYEAHRDKFR
jgi:hypothetical protein